VLYLLFETALGYGLFEVTESEEIGLQVETVQQSIQDLAKFGKICKLKSFVPFRSAEDALENINQLSEGIVHELLKNFLETNLPKTKGGKSSKFQLGVADAKIGQALKETLSIECVAVGVVPELIRGVRLHFAKMLKSIKDESLEKAQLGLGHSYSRAKVKFNVHRADNMIIQAICLLDQLDKDVNTFSMRIREWYGYHFPELVKIVNDNHLYAQLARAIGRRTTLNDSSIPMLEAIVADSTKAQQIIEAARASMGMDISDIDLLSIQHFSQRVVSLVEYRGSLFQYLVEKMHNVAPNLASLVGDQVGARLISHAGSLTSLAKYPASTVQILGAEKALFRALKTKGNTPKYGLLYNSTFIGRAGLKFKGRISRYVANKCSIASRIDCFSESLTDKFGLQMRDQVEERLRFYETGEAPRKNVDVMKSVIESMDEESAKRKATEAPSSEKKSKKKSKKESQDEEAPATPAPAAAPVSESTGEKKKKKSKDVEAEAAPMETDEGKPKKDKKKKKDSA